MKRRDFVKLGLVGAASLPLVRCETSPAPDEPSDTRNDIFQVTQIPTNAIVSGNRHSGVDTLLGLMGGNGLKFYRSSIPGALNGTNGLIAAADVVLIKVNAQWKYRGCTNSDLVRGVIQR
ncbi:MAG: hypothetical protein NTX99_10150, partial [Candidatus Aminicenantes bacterium]|nr:hypothetical protein [Candidatus Aminicenantes bacterium]